MSGSSAEARAQQRAALEEKRRKIEEMKKRRTRRDTDSARVRATANSNLDEYIDGLLSTPAAPGAAPAGGVVSATSSRDEGEAQSSAVTAGTQATSAGGASLDGDAKSAQSAASNVIAESAPPPIPKTVETFTVSTQTEEEDFPPVPASESELLDEEDESNDANKQNESSNEQKEGDVEGKSSLQEKDPKLLSTTEVEKEVSSQPFSSFINTASKKVERMLGTPLLGDLLGDYVGEADSVSQHRRDSDMESRFVSSRQVFECPKWTSGRDVTDMDWSPLHRELVLSTYHMASTTTSSATASKGSAAISAVAPNDTMSASLTPRSGELQSDGLALVWSLTMPTRPEHVFTCGSPITSGRFHPTESPLIIGGCESGQLVVWDVRAGRLPVQKSAFTTVSGGSSKGHVHPVDGMKVVEGGVSLADK